MRDKKLIINQIFLSKLWYIGQIYTIPKYINKEIETGVYDFLWEVKKIHPLRHLVQLSIWRGGPGILNKKTQLNSIKIKRIQRLFIPTNALWKGIRLYRLNYTLNSNQELALFRLNQILQFTRRKKLQKQNNADFFIQLNTWLHFISNNFPTPTSIE